MKKMKTINSDNFLKRQLKNNEFKKEYIALEEEFEISKEVIRLRKELNLTQKELADRAGTSQPAIARLESGNYKNVSLQFLRKVGNALGAIPEIHFKKVKTG
jgi:DNA-binding XRE family transcriptional regulator